MSTNHPQKKSTKQNKDQEDKSKKDPVAAFFSRLGYSVWMTVMIIGGIIAFVISLFLL